MKTIIKLAATALFATALVSCESFLDSANYSEANTGNYPASPADLNKELAALYGVMNQYCKDPLNTYFFVNSLMSDDCNGAGGTGDVECHAIGHLMTAKENMYDVAWHCTYVGIARANSIISAVDAFDWTGKENTRNQLLGEAYFMRGLFYLWGSQFWGDIPAYWTTAAPDPCPQQDAETVIYPHIMADFVSAYSLMVASETTQGDGHATKGAAAGYLARAYMFYEGFYKKAGELANANPEDIELPQQEGVSGKLSKAFVVSALEETMNSGKNSLVDDFRLLWQYTNELTAPDYPYVADLAAAGKYWAGNGNAEEMFQVQFGNFASWNSDYTMGYTNMTALYMALRCDDDGAGHKNGDAATAPFGQGWGQGVFNARLWDDWNDSDARKAATILNVDNELPSFVYTTTCSEDTGLYNKKYISVTSAGSSFDTNTDPYTWWGVYREQNTDVSNTNGSSFQGDHFNDIVLLRYADILLMHTELTGNADGMNKVRARAGLPATSYSWDTIKAERRFEFAGEGIRFNDLRRWSGKNGGENCEAAKALQRQDGTKVNYTGTATTMHHAASSWAKRYADTDGFLPIPPSQINITADESVLKQNPGWGSNVSDANMSNAPIYI